MHASKSLDDDLREIERGRRPGAVERQEQFEKAARAKVTLSPVLDEWLKKEPR